MQMPTQLTLQTDRQLMFIVLNNLLENACKYAPQETPIYVRLWQEPDKQMTGIEVRNQPDPAGWPDGAQVFDKYYRSPHARRQAGTGLGLYLVRNLVQTLGGQIRYAPDNTWVRFVIELPAIA